MSSTSKTLHRYKPYGIEYTNQKNEVIVILVCIDPGHNYSGYDTGATGYGLKEQDITFYIADLLRQRLEPLGVRCIMTRKTLTTNLGTSDASSLSARYTLATNAKADYFISIHCNSGNGNGTETLVARAGGTSEALAKDVQKAVVNKLHTLDRGIKYRPELAVLKHATMPAILVETAFIDSALDSELLRTRQPDFADAIARGFCNYTKIDYDIGGADMEELNAIKDSISQLTQAVDALSNRVNILEHPMIYNYVDQNMPEWAREPISALANAGILKGEDSSGSLGLSYEDLRHYTINYRAGVYDKALEQK